MELYRHDTVEDTDAPVGDRVRLYLGKLDYIEIVAIEDGVQIRCSNGVLHIKPDVANQITVKRTDRM